MNLKNIGLDNQEMLYEFLEQNLKKRIYEKNKFGEIFTPLWLINQILNRVPKQIWQDPDVKILDPAAGIGNYPVVMFYKLMKGLEKKIPDTQKRKKHILEKMIYIIEINGNNSHVIKKLLDQKNIYKLNIVTESFFENKLIVNNIDLKSIKYELIIGNPPYNENGNNKGKPFWPQFVYESLSLIKSNGYLCFIHPPGWRKPTSLNTRNIDLFHSMAKDATPLYLEMHDNNDGRKTFKTDIRYDWYIIKKKKNDGYLTQVKDVDGNYSFIDFSQYNWLPNNNFSFIKKIISKKPKFDNSRIICDSSYNPRNKDVNNIKNKKFKHILIHNTVKDATKCMYTFHKNNTHFNIPKVIFGETGSLFLPVLDVNGMYGMTRGAMAIPIKNKNDGIHLINFLTSPKIKNIVDKTLKWGNSRVEWSMFAYFKDGFWRKFKLKNKYQEKPLLCIASKKQNI